MTTLPIDCNVNDVILFLTWCQTLLYTIKLVNVQCGISSWDYIDEWRDEHQHRKDNIQNRSTLCKSCDTFLAVRSGIPLVMKNCHGVP